MDKSSRINLCYIVSDVNKALAFEWIADNLSTEKYRLSFILLNPGPSVLEDFLNGRNVPVYRVNCRGKKDWPKAVLQVKKLLKQIQPDIVHCHLLQATLIGLTAARLGGIRNRIYTRHHSSQHHIFQPKGVWLDKVSNRLATRIVATSGVVRDILLQWEHADPDKVKLVPHGFKLDAFQEVDPERSGAFRQRLGIAASQKIIGVISRFTELKGIQYIIPAFIRYHMEHPESILVLMNAQGDYEEHIRKQLADLPSDSYRLVVFENDVAAAYRSMDVFIHVPYDPHSEAFGQTYVEALAAGIPSIFTLSGIASDFIVDGSNALTVPFKDSDAIYQALKRLEGDPGLRDSLSKHGRSSVQTQFNLQKMIEQLEQIYDAG